MSSAVATPPAVRPAQVRTQPPSVRGAAKTQALRALRRLAGTGIGQRLVFEALENRDARAYAFQRLCNRTCIDEASFAGAYPDEARTIEGFEDLHWLYTSNALNQGLSRLMVIEAAYLYRVVRSLDSPRAAEIGRFKGGTTFLLAAAGAEVVSIDIDEAGQADYVPALQRALGHFGLADRVRLEVADSTTYPMASSSLDVVLLDGAYTYDGMRADVEHWLPSLVPGGHLLVHSIDPDEDRFPMLEPRLRGLLRLISELEGWPSITRVPGAPPSIAHFTKVPGPPSA